MRKLQIIFLLFLAWGYPVSGQYSISNGRTAAELAAQIEGSGIEILDAEVICMDSFQGIFTGSGDLGIDSGIVLSCNHTDWIFTAYDPGNWPRSYYDYYGYGNEIDTSYMTPIIRSWGGAEAYPLFSRNGCGLKLSFIPANDSISIDYIYADQDMRLSPTVEGGGFSFSSAAPMIRRGSWGEGPSYRFSPRCDQPGICLSGNEYGDTVNLAVYPGEPGVPVNSYSLLMDSIYAEEVWNIGEFYGRDYDTIWWDPGPGNRHHYVRNNDLGSLLSDFNYLGLTKVMLASAPVQACDTYQLVLAISGSRGLNTIVELAGSAVFFGKLRSPGPRNTDCTDTSVSVAPDAASRPFCTVYPNPFGSSLQLRISESVPVSAGYSVVLTDILGREVYRREGALALLNRELSSIGAGLIPGSYLLQVSDPESGRSQVIRAVRE